MLTRPFAIAGLPLSAAVCLLSSGCGHTQMSLLHADPTAPAVPQSTSEPIAIYEKADEWPESFSVLGKVWITQKSDFNVPDADAVIPLVENVARRAGADAVLGLSTSRLHQGWEGLIFDSDTRWTTGLAVRRDGAMAHSPGPGFVVAVLPPVLVPSQSVADDARIRASLWIGLQYELEKRGYFARWPDHSATGFDDILRGPESGRVQALTTAGDGACSFVLASVLMSTDHAAAIVADRASGPRGRGFIRERRGAGLLLIGGLYSKETDEWQPLGTVPAHSAEFDDVLWRSLLADPALLSHDAGARTPRSTEPDVSTLVWMGTELMERVPRLDASSTLRITKESARRRRGPRPRP